MGKTQLIIYALGYVLLIPIIGLMMLVCYLIDSIKNRTKKTKSGNNHFTIQLQDKVVPKERK